MSSRPSTAAPPRVPSRSASRTVIAVGPPRPRATSSACLTSRKRSLRSFDAEPSTPSPTGAPASTSSRTGATPAPSRRFDVGQCATPTPCAPERGDVLRRRGGRSARTRRRLRPSRARSGTRPAGSRRARRSSRPPRPSRRDACAASARASGRAPPTRPSAPSSPRTASTARPRAAPSRPRPAARRAARCRRGSRRSTRPASPAAARRPTRRDPSTRATRRSARRSRRPPAPPPPRARAGRAERRSGGRTPLCSPTTPARRAPYARPRTPISASIRAHTGYSSRSHSKSVASCARARVSVWYRWWWVFTSPGVTTAPREVDDRVRGRRRAPSDRLDEPVADEHPPVRKLAARSRPSSRSIRFAGATSSAPPTLQRRRPSRRRRDFI